MTAQIPDKLINEYPLLDLDGLYLYGVICRDFSNGHGWGKPYEFSAQPKRTGMLSTALYRGYIATFRLTEQGQLELVEYDYGDPLFDPAHAPDPIHEMAVGDFWLVMRPHFLGEGTYIPFRNGRVVVDRAEWIYLDDGLIPHMQVRLTLKNECANLELGRLELCAVVNDIHRGDRYPFSFSSQSIQDEDFPPDRWERHETAFRIRETGELALIGAELINDRQSVSTRYKIDDLDEIAEGDFWLVMKEYLSTVRVFIPFRNGKVIPDKSQWIYE